MYKYLLTNIIKISCYFFTPEIRTIYSGLKFQQQPEALLNENMHYIFTVICRSSNEAIILSSSYYKK